MGSGKGAPEYWAAVVKPGTVMFEMAGVSEEVAREALRLASYTDPDLTAALGVTRHRDTRRLDLVGGYPAGILADERELAARARRSGSRHTSSPSVAR